MPPLFADASRTVIVAVDHPLYCGRWPGLEDRRALIGRWPPPAPMALIATYGTLRDCADAFADCTRIMKLDLATVSVGAYRDSEFRLGLDGRRRGPLGRGRGADVRAARHRRRARRARSGGTGRRRGRPRRARYVCEIMPVESAALSRSVPAGLDRGGGTDRPPSWVRTSSRRRCRRRQRRSRSRRRADLPVVIAGGEPTVDTEGCSAGRDARSPRAQQASRLDGTSGGAPTRPGWCGRCGRQLISQNAGSLANSHS